MGACRGSRLSQASPKGVIEVPGRSSWRKGIRAEREFAKLTGGVRVPLSGAAGGPFSGDVLAFGLRWQVKWDKDGWRTLYKLLENADALALRAPRKRWLVVMPYETFIAQRGGTHDA